MGLALVIVFIVVVVLFALRIALFRRSRTLIGALGARRG